MINDRNRLALACWSAILPIAFTHFTVAFTGWPQLGYRFALDYYPFLFLLSVWASASGSSGTTRQLSSRAY
jgi:hypothetical protein